MSRFPVLICHILRNIKALTGLYISREAVPKTLHIFIVRGSRATAPRMKRRRGNADLILTHRIDLAVKLRAKAASLVVKGFHNNILLDAKVFEAVLAGLVREGGALGHNQTPGLRLRDLKTVGDSLDGFIRCRAAHYHLSKLRVDAVDERLLVRPDSIAEGLAV